MKASFLEQAFENMTHEQKFKPTRALFAYFIDGLINENLTEEEETAFNNIVRKVEENTKWN